MANDSINEIVYKHLKNSDAMKEAFNKVFYLVNDNKIKQPFAVTYMLDDPNEIHSLCATDQGQSRFQCDTFTKTFVKGISYRDIFKTTIKELEATITGSFNIWKIDIVNTVDRSDTIEGLFQFAFECIINWTKA